MTLGQAQEIANEVSFDLATLAVAIDEGHGGDVAERVMDLAEKLWAIGDESMTDEAIGRQLTRRGIDCSTAFSRVKEALRNVRNNAEAS